MATIVNNPTPNAYLTYVTSSKYLYNPGVMAVPLGIPPSLVAQLNDLNDLPANVSSQPTMEIVQVSAPVQFRVLTFEATRFDDAPQIPGPNLSALVGEQLVTAEVETFSPGYSEDGQRRIYGIRGKYVYAAAAPTSWNVGLKVDQTPLGPTTLTTVGNPYLTTG